jgi:antitoxin component YwqK of YwqJK toxin-antitoxin module
MFRVLTSALLLFGMLALQAQNLLDEQGRKTGHWKVEYPSGSTLYEADFVEGNPVGTMVRYYENGAVKARMEFEAGGDRSLTHLFYNNGKLAAVGWYTKQLKDSVWTYYSELDGSVRVREPYLEGKLDGVVRSYYPDGKISEEVSWKQNLKEGPWKRYYQDGTPRLSGHFKNGLQDGSYEVFYSNGTNQIKGEYLDDKSQGTWYFYDEDGNAIDSLEYLHGTPADREKYDSLIADSLMHIKILTEPEFIQQP